MRYVCSTVATVVALSILTPFGASGQSSGLSVTNYQVVSEERLTRTQSNFVYRADLVNAGPARTAVTATVTSKVPSVQVVQGHGTLHFLSVPANSQVISSDTFTVLVDRTVPFDPANLQWSFSGPPGPLANAGPNQTAPVGSTVTLNGSGSSNPSGIGTLSYSWAFTSRPSGSTAALSNPTAIMPTFRADVAGTYILTLTVSNGSTTDSANVTVSSVGTPPVANAGPNQTIAVGSNVNLNGSASSDVDGDPLTYAWTLITRPAGSTATLTGAASVTSAFTADKAGTYVAQLVVNDGRLNSTPALVTITTTNTSPVANPGANQTVNVNATVQLNGAGSTDVDGDSLTYQWSLITVPAGSTAALSSATAINPTFLADRSGTYVAQLIVNDGKVSSSPAPVTITTNAVQAPTANAGSNQTVVHGATVNLIGSGTDPQSFPLTAQWALISKPQGSTAGLLNSSGPGTGGGISITSSPTFTADRPGTYVAQLIVNNGVLNSAPVTVTITTTNTPPVANAGPNQNVPVGSTVVLDGSGTSDADNDPLSYLWSFTSRPNGSSATLSAATSPSPTFFADVPGTYVLQLIVNDGFTNSNPATVTITASANAVTLSPDPLNVFLNASGTLTITLPTAAGPGGQLVRLASLDPSVATVPGAISIPEATSTGTVTIIPGAIGTTLISATVGGFRPGTATVNVGTPSISITLPSTVGLSRTVNGTVTLNAPAPPEGTLISITTNNNGIITLQPATVAIAAGSTTGTFTVTGVAQGSATVAASAPGYTSGSANINVGQLGLIVLQPNITVGPGQSVPFPVSLATPAPVGGVVITLSSSDPSRATITPETVTIPQGAQTPVTQPQVNGIDFGLAVITATAPGFTGDRQTVQVTATLLFSPGALTVGANGSQNLTLTLSSPAPAGGLAVTLNSNRPDIATVPASVVIPQNTTSITVPVTGIGVGSATVTAATSAPNIAGASANITVLVFGTVSLPSNVNAGLGQSVPFPVTLSSPAPAGGVTLTLSSSDPSRVSVSPTSVFIPAGQTQPTTQPQVTGINLGTATISASASGFGSTSQVVRTTASLSFSPNTLTVSAGSTQNLTLTLSGLAPAGGVTVNLSSDNPGAATVPANVTIAQNSTSVSVPVTGVAPGSTVIRASGPNLAEATASINVQAAGGISLPSNVTLTSGQSAPFVVTLSAPAPAGGVTVTLSSSDPSRVSISPATVFIPAGQTQSQTTPQVTGGNFGSATINASAPGLGSANQTVQVGAALTFAPPVLAVAVGGTQNLTLALSAPAPAGGLTVTLSSSNPAAAGVPGSVTIAQNTTSIIVPVTGTGVGSATITASTAAPNVSGTTATVNVSVQTAGTISLPSSVTVAAGQSVPFPVTLSGPAPAGGLTVTLASSDPSKVSVSPATVTIAAGQTQPSQQPQVTGVSFGTANISASAPGYTPASQAVQTTGAISFTPSALTLRTSDTQNLTLTLSGPAPAGGLTVNLSSSNPAVATVPSTVAVAQGTTTVTVPVTSLTAGSTAISASAPNLASGTANVTVTPPVDIILPANLVVAPGEQVPFTISLARPSAEVTFIDLTISDSSRATLSQQTIFIRAGQTEPLVQPRITGISPGPVTITATSFGLASATTTAQVGFGLNFTPSSLTITGAATQNITLTLSGPAPAEGLVVNLTSSNTGVATVQSSVTFGPNSTSANIPVNGVAPGTAVIRATAPNLPDATANITVATAASIVLPANTAVRLETSVPFPITLSTPAPFGGVTVTLTSSDTHRVTVTSSVFVPAGQTQPAAQPQVTGVNVGAANITASAPGYTPATQTVQVGATVTFTQSNLTVGQNSTGILLLALSASAPLEGLVVTLTSSNPDVVRIQPSVNFYPDGSEFTTVAIVVNGVSPGTAIIRASGLNIPEVSATVTVPGSLAFTTASLTNGTVGVPYSQTLAATGGTAPYSYFLSSGALPGGLSLDSSTGGISGTPTTPISNTPLTFRVTDSASPSRAAVTNLTLTVTPSSPASITATGGTPQSAPINTAFGVPLVATVRDANGNPVSGATVTFTAPGGGASGTFAGGANTAVTNASGVATSAAFTANASVGNYTVTASVPGVAASASFSLSNTVGSPASIAAASGTPQNAAINTAFGAPLAVIVKDGNGNPVNGVTVTFTVPGGGASGTFAGGVNTAVTDSSGVAATTTFMANGTIGSYTVNALVSGVSAPAVFSLTNTVGSPASITATGGTPQSTQIGTAFSAPLIATVRDAGGNPVSGVVVTFTPPGGGASGTFANGANTAVTNTSGVAASATFTANNSVGSYTVAASASGVGTPANFTLANTGGVPASIVATGGTPQATQVATAFASPLSVTVRDEAGNPVNGVTVMFTGPPSGASGTFPGAVNTAVTNASGVATSLTFTATDTPGSYSVSAFVGGVSSPATFSLTNTPVNNSPAIGISNATVGQGLQAPISLTIPQPAPPGGLRVTVASANPNLVLIAGRPGDAGTPQITLTIGEGLSTVGGIYVQGLASSGTTQVTASAPGYNSGTATATLAPAGFILAGPSGPGGANFSSPQNVSTTLTVYAVRLDSSLNFVENQQVAGGTSVTVPISNTTPAVGTVSPASVTLNGGTATATVVFNAQLTGSTTLTAEVPAGFSTLANGANTLTANVTPSGLSAGEVTVGQNLQATTRVTLNGAAPSAGLSLTITSNDTSRLLLSQTATGTGSASITLDVQGGRTTSPEFYVQGLANSGTATFVATATGFGTTVGTANLRPSGFVVNGPFGLGSNFLTTTGAPNIDLTVFSALLDPSGNFAGIQDIRGGLTVNVSVTSSNPAVGTITTSPVVFSGGSSSATTQFDPIAEGDTVLAVNAPAGFRIPAQNASITASVRTPALSVSGAVTIGRNLQAIGTLLLGQPAPTGGVAVTLTSNSGQLLLSTSATAAGAPTITITIPAGQSNANYFLQAVGDTGTATYTASAPGYQSRTGNVILAPSGVVITGPFGFGFPLAASVGGGNQPVTVFVAQLDPVTNDYVMSQPLAGGRTLSVSLSNANPAVGTVSTPVTIAGGSDNGVSQFTPLANGQTVISVNQPAGYTTPSNNTTLIARVN